MRLARPIYKAARIPHRAVVLNPFSPELLMSGDRARVEAYGLVAVDCSWEKADNAFGARLPGSGRRLPTLLAANPTNYAKQHKLSSVEALAAALYITGFGVHAERLLSTFKWGNTFLTLNREPLESYSCAKSPQEMAVAEAEFF